VSGVFLPKSLGELWQEMDRRPNALIYAGGTDLLVRLRKESYNKDRDLICLERLHELKRVEQRGAEIFLGAGCTHAQLLNSPLVIERLPLLAQALRVLGSPLVRNAGTIGGNIATASPAGDTLPPLYVLGASVEIVSPGDARRMAISDFINAPGQTALRSGEVLSGVSIPVPSEHAIHHFEKVGQRAALAISIASMAALVELDKSDRVIRAKLAWGSVGPTVVTCRPAEAALEGRPFSSASLSEAAAIVKQAVSPIDDIRASAVYRREAAGNMLLRLVRPELLITNQA
jgi:CO/xanthine dehydrogenase FAD-binding subunit